MKWTLRMTGKDMKLLLWGIVVGMVSTGMIFINPVIYSHIIDDVLTGGRMELLAPYLWAVIGCTLLRAGVIYANAMMLETATQNTIRRLRLYLYDKLGTLDTAFYSKNRTGDLMMKLSGDLDWVRHFLVWIVPNTITNAILFIVTLVILLQNWNAQSPILITLSGTVTFVSSLQPENVSLPMLVTPSGIVTLIMFVQQ